jgi:nitrogen-specific signal transduction histidine kinase
MRDHANDFLAQQDLRVLLDHAPDAIARFDRQLRHVYVNEATARANNRPVADFYGKTMDNLGHAPEVCSLINHGLHAVFATGQEQTLELLFPGPHGPVWYQSRMAPEFSADGLVEFVLVMSRDITNLKRAELAMREIKHAAAVAQLSADMAHDIHNPLSAAINALYLLKYSSTLDPANRVWVDLASEQLDRISVISKGLLRLGDKVGADSNSESSVM